MTTPTTLSRYKHYAGAVDLEVDFVNRLQTGETLASGATATAQTSNNSSGSAGDLTLGSASISGTKVVVRASAGKCHERVQVEPPRWETRYTIKASVVTSSGETESELIELVVYDSVERT